MDEADEFNNHGTWYDVQVLSWNYSTMNLKAFFELASLADNVGIDLWNYVSPGGKSIRYAFTWMLPYAREKKTWEHKQIKAMDYGDFALMAGMVSKKYPGVDVKPLLAANKTVENSMLLLTGSVF